MSDLILLNGDVRTQDSRRPRAEAVAIRANRLAAVGRNEEIKNLARPGARVIDLGGRLVLPGLTDSHIHVSLWATSLKAVPLSDASSLTEVLRRVAEAAQKASPGGWIQGMGLDETRWPEGRLPARRDLDQAAPNHPVLLRRRDGHLAVANSRALALAGMGDHAPDPPAGSLERDEAGRPTGVLKERAIDLVDKIVPEPAADELAGAIKEALPRLHALGLTGIHDMRVWGAKEGQRAFKAWRRLDEAGALNVRCWMCLSGESLDQAAALGLRTGFGHDRLRLGHLKFFADGSMGSGTAWVIEPYRHGGRGLPVCDVAELAAAIEKADRAGLAVAVHAIGDRANQELIAIFEKLETRRSAAGSLSSPRPTAGHRLEHAQMIRPSDLRRLARLGVFVSVQPLHVTEDIIVHERYVGSLTKHVYPFRDMIDASLCLVFGSDCPVVDPNPWRGVHAAVTRTRPDGSPPGGWHPEQRLSLDEAIWAYTMGPALVCGRGEELGSLSPGKLADLIVLDRNIYHLEPSKVHQAQVDLTIMDGQIVFERSG